MLVWDYEWRGHEHKIDQLSFRQKVDLCLACIDDSLQLLGEHFCRQLVDEFGDALRSAWEGFWSINCSVGDDIASLTPHIEALECRIGAMENSGSEMPGFYDTIMGVAELIRGLETGMPRRMTVDCTSYAYQAVLDVEVLSTLDRSIGEEEERELERANSKCMTCIQHQLEFLKLVAAGQTINRKTVL